MNTSSVVYHYISGPSVDQAFQNLFLFLVHPHIDYELGQVTFFGQWDISKCNASQGFISVCTLRLALLKCRHYPVESPDFLLERPHRKE